MLINFTYDFAFVPVPFFSSRSAIFRVEEHVFSNIPYLSDEFLIRNLHQIGKGILLNTCFLYPKNSGA